MPHSNQNQCFLFNDTDVYDGMIGLKRSYNEVLAKRLYPEPVAQLLREIFTATSLFCGMLKFGGLLVLQARSSSTVPLSMVECSSDRQVHGLVRYSAEPTGVNADMQEPMPEGVPTLTVDPAKDQRYQGTVTLEGVNLVECPSNYLVSSEQLPARFWPNANGRRVCGLLLQQLPIGRLKGPGARETSWQYLTTLAGTLTAEELLVLDNETVLHYLYHEETACLLELQPLVFHCSCSRERPASALVSFGQADCRRLFEEEGSSITIDCQPCNQHYLFNASNVAQLSTGAGSRGPSGTRH